MFKEAGPIFRYTRPAALPDGALIDVAWAGPRTHA
jgi:hypothetical protein